MDAAKLFEGIALLIELAQRGEIDPWDVQVIEVIDRYLSELVPSREATQAAREADLSQSGQAFLSASMLVLFKANTLAELEAEETAADLAEDTLAVEDGTPTKRLPLEQQLRRRPAALPPQKRRVTLQELINQLQLMATQLQLAQEAESKTARNSRLRASRSQAARATLELAHQENLTEVAEELEQFLNFHAHDILEQQDWLDLDQLVTLWAKKTQPVAVGSAQEYSLKSTQTHDRVSVFWALLLLSAQSKVELVQEEFYQDIQIRTLDRFTA